MGFEGPNNDAEVVLPATAKEAFEDWKTRSDSQEGVDVMTGILDAMEAGDKELAMAEIRRLIDINEKRLEEEGDENMEGEIGPTKTEKLKKYKEYLAELSK